MSKFLIVRTPLGPMTQATPEIIVRRKKERKCIDAKEQQQGGVAR
jgi:hypothetical protein